MDNDLTLKEDENSHTTPMKQHRSLWRSTAVVSAMTMLSRILGFVRDMVTTNLFGASMGTDAFLVAFKIPNFMRRLFAEGAFSQAFVPILSEYQQKKSKEDVQRFVRHTAGWLGGIVLMVTVVAIVASPFLIRIFAPGFDVHSTRFLWASDMLRITFPYLFFISLAALAGSVLNTYGAFGIPAFTPVLLNLAMIGAAIWLSPFFHPSIEALAWGVFLGGILQLAYQLPRLYRLGFLQWPQFQREDPGVRRVLRQMVPALFGVSVSQINLLMDTLFSSFLPVGSVTWLYLSDRVTSLPLGVFGVALATVTLPHLSRHHALEETRDFGRVSDWALRNILVLGLPSTLGIVLLANPLLITLFEHGAFNLNDVFETKRSLIAFAVGIPAFMAVKVLATFFYARHDIRTPVRIAVVAMITNVVLNFLLIQVMAHAGLALATSIAAFLNAGLLAYFLRKRRIFRLEPGWWIFLLRLAAGCTALVLSLIWLTPELTRWTDAGTLWRIGYLFGLIFLGTSAYLLTLYAVGLRWRGFSRG